MTRPATLSRAEALRTLGTMLESEGVARVELLIAPSGLSVDPLTGDGARWHTWEMIAAESERQRGQRQARTAAMSWTAPQALTRWSALLRIVGQLLDARHVETCAVEAAVAPPEAPRKCVVQVTVNNAVVLDAEDVHMHLLHVRTEQLALQQPTLPPGQDLEDAEPRRPWWAFWRRATR